VAGANKKGQTDKLRHGNDIANISDRFRPADVLVALALLTRLPLPYPRFDATRPAAAAAWAYPLVGAVVGAILVIAITVLTALGLPASLAVFLGLALATLVTGAMHEDGLADCADGFWGGWTTARRLEIMKDSQIGTYGVLALVLSMGIRWQAIVLLMNGDALFGVIYVEVISRAAMVWVMYRLPNARKSGLSDQTGRPEAATCGVAIALAAAAALLTPAPIPVMFAAILATFGFARLARSKIGGQTGDVLGATQQIVAVLTLCIIAA
tara:strand:- start:3724 stop:4527 length:804 start_codon:yes stop_codon:yes gene_type:complete